MRVAIASLLLASCTFGGSEEDPTNGLSAMTGTLDAGEPSTADDDDGDDGAGDDEEPMSRLDASMWSDATVIPSDATVADGGRRDAGRADAGGNMCTPVTAPAVCDPVKNTGCSLFLRCDLDPAASTPAGRCLFTGLSLGGECTANALSTTCEVGSTCVDGACRKTCYCNADCGAAQKCTGTAPGAEGPVKLCE
ncbi:MAG: hypothetical protein ABW352_09030 [Polyangiales bacterium]